MKLEEFLVGTKEDIKQGVDQITTEKEWIKYYLKWSAYAFAEFMIGVAGLTFAKGIESNALYFASLPFFIDGGYRVLGTTLYTIKNVNKIHRENADKPRLENFKAKLKDCLQPGLVGLVKGYFTNKSLEVRK